MSLTKLFNFNYMFENIKKSKMAIILCILVVPFFTTILLLTSSNTVFSFISLASFNIAFMYLIPVLLSVSLFGYIYKKNSVDFIGSMPLSRKTIFLTNTLAGICIILIMQLITLLLTLIISTFSESIIFASLAWDVFVYQTVAYIFTFTIANLAMSVSGNVMTQFAMTLLIAFLIPTLLIYTTLAGGFDTSKVLSNNIYFSRDISFETLTAPSLIINGSYKFNVISIIKMLVLSVAYAGVGLVLFNKRKMEKVGESFVKRLTHYIIKSLTLVPFVMILKIITYEGENTALPFVLGIIFIYWLVYDLITNKKTKFLKSCGILIIAVVINYAVLTGLMEAGIALSKINVKPENVARIEFNANSAWDEPDSTSKIYSISDKELIKSILLNDKDYKDGEVYYPSLYYRNPNGKTNQIATSLSGIVYMKNGSKYSISATISNSDLEKMQQYVKETQTLPLNKNVQVSLNSKIVDKVTKKELVELIKQVKPSRINLVNSYFIDTYYSTYLRDNYLTLTAYEYVNHEIYKYEYSENDSKELKEKLFSIYNDASYRLMSNITSDKISYYSVSDGSLGYGSNNSNSFKKKLKEFIINEKDTQVNLDKEFVRIRISIRIDDDNVITSYFITNKVDYVKDKLIDYWDKEEYDKDKYYYDDGYYYEDINHYEIIEDEEIEDSELIEEEIDESELIIEPESIGGVV